jgi:DNA-binding MarR family transcriptional regulator/N-acetylglutamate synthase-like GNAT family acetyltransferase
VTIPAGRILAVRRFNRFYTKQIGLLDEALLRSPFSLTEARLIYELAQRDHTTPTQLAEELGLDPGYVSRLLKSLEQRGLVDRRSSGSDRRHVLLRLSRDGARAFAALDDASQKQLSVLLSSLSDGNQLRLIDAMARIEAILGAAPAPPPPHVLRPHHVGDLGWVVWRHGVLYAEEYGWNEEFEALVASIVAKFVREYDAARERCWIAEQHGENVGSVFIVKESETVARLRLLLVEPSARGLGLGGHLVEACIRFARQARYECIRLWTNDVLTAARRIYERAGFVLKHEAPHHAFGRDLVEQTWELVL